MFKLENLDIETMRGSCPWRSSNNICFARFLEIKSCDKIGQYISLECSIKNCAVLYWLRVLQEGLSEPKEP